MPTTVIQSENALKKVLITGANGFVGKALRQRLITLNIDVVSIVRNSEKKDAGTFYVVPDFTVTGVWQKPLSGCDTIIHLAARAHKVSEDLTHFYEKYIDANVESTLCLAKEAINSEVKRFVYVSSIGVHGDETRLEPFTEYSPICPNSNYSNSKYLAEKALTQLCIESNLELVIVRPPLVYGPNNPGNMLKLMNLISLGLPLPFSNIKNLRSLIYLGNLIDALILCASHPNAANQVYVVSDNEKLSTPQLIKDIATLMNRRCFLFPVPLQIMRYFTGLVKKSSALDKLNSSLVVDSSKIRRELGWQPPYTMVEGLKVTADWFKQTHQKGHN